MTFRLAKERWCLLLLRLRLTWGELLPRRRRVASSMAVLRWRQTYAHRIPTYRIKCARRPCSLCPGILSTVLLPPNPFPPEDSLRCVGVRPELTPFGAYSMWGREVVWSIVGSLRESPESTNEVSGDASRAARKWLRYSHSSAGFCE